MGDQDTPIRRQSAYSLIALGTRLKNEIDDRLAAEVGHSLADNEALANLRDAGGPLRMGDIRDLLTLSSGGVTKLIDRLEAAGYVVRDADPSDRRAVAVSITPAGRAALGKSRKVLVAALDEMWTDHITDDQAEELLRILSRVHKANWCT